MKKVTIILGNDGAQNFEEFYAAMIESFAEEDLLILANTVRGLQDSGDMWFRHYYQEGNQNHLVYIFDSASAVTSFEPAKSVIENMPLFESYNVEDITFEQFANYASSANETSIENARVNTILDSE